jgi:hypothetical protein
MMDLHLELFSLKDKQEVDKLGSRQDQTQLFCPVGWQGLDDLLKYSILKKEPQYTNRLERESSLPSPLV